jgi:hypothetical protein
MHRILVLFQQGRGLLCRFQRLVAFIIITKGSLRDDPIE